MLASDLLANLCSNDLVLEYILYIYIIYIIIFCYIIDVAHRGLGKLINSFL